MMKPKLIVADLEAFKVAARELGATKVETWKYDEEDVRAGRQRAPDPKFRWWMSADSGGCGSSGCQCSPGLWISASQGNEIAVAHFGYGPFGRGTNGFFTRRDHRNWLRFQRLLKREAYSPP
jgi:hypothetical protein